MRTRIILTNLAAVFVAACGGTSSGGDGRLVLAGFYPLAYVAEQVAGEDAEVVNLTPPGAEPHDAELSPREVERVRDADLVLYLGGGFQPALERAVEDAGGRAVDLLGGLDLHEEEPGTIDPHVWLDPIRFAEIAERVGETLEQPERAETLAEALRSLDRELAAGLADCDRRELVTSHAAFGYLADRYGLEQIALTGVTPESEPPARKLQELVRRVRESGATTVYFETLVSPRLAETVAREAGARAAVLNPLEGLTDEELRRGGDYFSVMRENLAALRQGLGCR